MINMAPDPTLRLALDKWRASERAWDQLDRAVWETISGRMTVAELAEERRRIATERYSRAPEAQ